MLMIVHLEIEEAAEIFKGFTIFNDNKNNNRLIYSWQKEEIAN